MTKRGAVLRVSVIGALAAAALSVPAVATAQTGADSSGSDFGRHVETCAQTMGFDGTHNPGMHQGLSGWDAAHEC